MKLSLQIAKTLRSLIAPLFASLTFAGVAQADTPEQALGSLLESFVPWYEDLKEDPHARKARLRTIARAQLYAAQEATCTGHAKGSKCKRKFGGSAHQLIALLLTAGWWETRFSRRVHAGECRKDECDGGRARSVYQVQLNGVVPRELWENAEGLDWDSTLAATRAATFSFSAAWRACRKRHGVRGVWGAYGRGFCGGQYQVLQRTRWYQRQLQNLERLFPAGAAAR